jgi:hypothetical protein
MKKDTIIFALLLLFSMIAACNTQEAEIRSESNPTERNATKTKKSNSATFLVTTEAPQITSSSTPEPLMETNTPQTTATVITITQTATKTKPSVSWDEYPIVPAPSNNVITIFKHGQELGNREGVYSKIGDCGSTPSWFLGDFDRGEEFYRLGEYTYLQDVIDAFKGSHERTSLAAMSGFNASSLFSPLWSDKSQCKADESPLECEIRVNKPIIVMITLGTNDVYHPDEFEPQMRKIIEFLLEKGVIPILATKADNLEMDHSINITIVNLAEEYDIPLWNFWKAVQPLPNHGLQKDGAHLTWGKNYFDDPFSMTKAWPVRNLTALQALDAVWRKINSENK